MNISTHHQQAPTSGQDRGALINEQIGFREVRLIDENGQNVGVVSRDQALRQAINADLDLVVMNETAHPPVCKIMDYGKFRYEERKRKTQVKKNQKIIQVKEVKLRPMIDEHDFQVKLKKVRQFIGDGNRVRVTLRFRGRELSHQEFGLELLHRVRDLVSDIAKVDQEPNMEGRQMIMLLVAQQQK